MDLFDKCKDILVSKGHDYSTEKDNHSNFKYSGFIAEAFPVEYKSYAVLIGTKLARISTLLQKKEAKNESIEDSFIDLINYVALMYERYRLEEL